MNLLEKTIGEIGGGRAAVRADQTAGAGAEMNLLEKTIGEIRPVDVSWIAASEKRQLELTKPLERELR